MARVFCSLHQQHHGDTPDWPCPTCDHAERLVEAARDVNATIPHYSLTERVHEAMRRTKGNYHPRHIEIALRASQRQGKAEDE